MLTKYLLTLCLFCLSIQLIGQQDEIEDFSYYVYPIKVDNKWGFMNKEGQQTIEPQYDAHKYLKYNYILVEQDKKVGLLDSVGNPVLPIKYQRIRPLKRDLFAVVKDTLEVIVDEQDNLLVTSGYQRIEILNNDFFAVKIDSLWGIHGRGSQQIAPPIYHKVSPVNGGKGYFKVYQQIGKKRFANLMNLEGELLFGFEQLDINVITDSLFLFKSEKTNGWGMKDLEGQILHEPAWLNASKLNPYLVKIKLDARRTGLFSISRRAMLELDGNYADFEYLDDRYVKPVKGYRRGLMDSVGNTILKAEYHNIQTTKYPQYFRVQQGSWGMYDIQKDSLIVETVNSQIHPFDNGLATLIMGGLYGAVNFKGKIVLPAVYDKIERVDNLIKTYKEGERLLLRLNSEGELEVENSFKKVKSLSIGRKGRGNSNSIFRPRTVDRMAVGPYFWRRQNGRYGVYDRTNRQFVVPPTFRSVYQAQEAGVTIVITDSIVQTTGLTIYNNLPVDEVYQVGLFSHEQLRLLTIPKDIIGIRYADFRQGNGVAAFIDTIGRYGLISSTGQVMAYDTSYQFIGYFKNGLARVYTNGTLLNGSQTGYKGNPTMGSVPNIVRGYGIRYVRDKPERGSGYLLQEDGLWGYLNTQGQLQIKPQFLYARAINTEGTINRKQTGWGIMDVNGQPILDYQYIKIENFGRNLLKLQTKSQYITSLDENGNATFSKYERQGKFIEGLCRVAKRNKQGEIRWGYINKELEEVIPIGFRQARDFAEGWASVADSSGWYFINTKGETVLRLHKAIKDVGNFHEDVAWVKIGSFYGYVDREGAFVLRPKYNKADDFSFGVARVFLDKKATLIDKSGSFVVGANEYTTIKPMSQYGLAVVQKRGRRLMGLIDYNGKVILPPRYDQISQYDNGIATIRLLGKFGFIDSTGRVIIETQFEKVGKPRNGLIAVSKSGSGGWYYINYAGKKAFKANFYKAKDFKKGFAVVTLMDDNRRTKTALIDQKGKFHYISTESKELLDYAEGFRNIKEVIKEEDAELANKNIDALTTYEVQYFTDANNQQLFDTYFEEVYPFENDVAFMVTDKGWGALNRRGFKIIKDKYIRLIRQKGGKIRGKAPYMYGIAQKDGTIILPPQLDYVKLLSGNIYQVERDSQIGYMNQKGEWIWELK